MRLVHKLVALAAFTVSIASAQGAFAQAKTFKVQSGESQVQFVSEATLENFTGKNTQVSGSVTVDPAKIESAKGDVSIDAAAFKTNVELRDEHLRSDSWLDAAKFKLATFTITKISGASALKANEVTDVKVTGKLKLHGKEKEITTTAKVRWIPGSGGAPDQLRVQTSFDVALSDFEIKINPVVELKVAKVIKVNVDLRATTK